MFDRDNVNIEMDNPASVENYMKTNFKNELKDKSKLIKEDKKSMKKGYNFEKVMDYYNKRAEFDVVGIIEKNLNKLASSDIDNFKIRGRRPKILDKKRGTGIPSLKGAVCSTSKDKKYLLRIISKLPDLDKYVLKNVKRETREYICDIIKKKLMYMEKYSTTKEKNKLTYVMIPYDHPKLIYPLNLEDRLKHFIDYLQKSTGIKLDHTVKKTGNGIFMDVRNKDFVKYQLIFENKNNYSKESEFIERHGGKLIDKKWIVNLE
jgi:hypothetical protein